MEDELCVIAGAAYEFTVVGAPISIFEPQGREGVAYVFDVSGKRDANVIWPTSSDPR